ncbi:hypothetical protein [Streptomyces sp. NPDC091215]|uniref:hypothetical protein n=1 Tax=Streptomyces sp. NPDC091215 TaxID=3155192 RepID=UPI00343EB736
MARTKAREMQFAINRLGHFALAAARRTALAAAHGARVVAVSSVGHVNGHVTHAALPHLPRAAGDFPRRVADLVNISFTAGYVARPGKAVCA